MRQLRVLGAAEHNLRDVDVTFGPGLTAVVGVSGSGKSSLAFDVVYAEARRRFVESLALGGNAARVPAAQVRQHRGLGTGGGGRSERPQPSTRPRPWRRRSAAPVPADPVLTVRRGRMPQLPRYRFGRCPPRSASPQPLDLLAATDSLDVEVAIVRGLTRSHARLLAGLRGQFDAVTSTDVRGRRSRPAGCRARPGAAARRRRASRHASGRSVGGRGPGHPRACRRVGQTRGPLGGTPVLRAPICPQCSAPGSGHSRRRPFAADNDTSSHRIAGVTLTRSCSARSVTEVLEFVQQLPLGVARHASRTSCYDDCGRCRSWALATSPSTGRCRRCRAARRNGRGSRSCSAVVSKTCCTSSTSRPSGLHHSDLRRLLDAIAALPGPVLMVEHDPLAVAMADDVVEIGPGGGDGGGRLVFQGPPADLWRADTASGIGFSAAVRRDRAQRPVSDDRIRHHRGEPAQPPRRRLRDPARIADRDHRAVRSRQDHPEPGGAAGVVCASAARSAARRSTRRRCALVAVDQAPLGNNPRSNPATYTKVLDRIRDVFANETGRSASDFTFNRAEGACPDCEGMGSVAIGLSYLAPIWVPCEACDGRRYRPEVLEATWAGRSIADVLALSVDEATAVFAEHPVGDPHPATSAGGRARLFDARATVSEPFRWGSPTRTAGPRGGQGEDRRPRTARRAHDGAAPWRPRPAPRGARPADGQRLHGGRRRAPA